MTSRPVKSADVVTVSVRMTRAQAAALGRSPAVITAAADPTTINAAQAALLAVRTEATAAAQR